MEGMPHVMNGRYATCDEWKVHKFQIDVQQDVLAEEQGVAVKQSLCRRLG